MDEVAEVVTANKKISLHVNSQNTVGPVALTSNAMARIAISSISVLVCPVTTKMPLHKTGMAVVKRALSDI